MELSELKKLRKTQEDEIVDLDKQVRKNFPLLRPCLLIANRKRLIKILDELEATKQKVDVDRNLDESKRESISENIERDIRFMSRDEALNNYNIVILSSVIAVISAIVSCVTTITKN